MFSNYLFLKLNVNSTISCAINGKPSINDARIILGDNRIQWDSDSSRSEANAIKSNKQMLMKRLILSIIALSD